MWVFSQCWHNIIQTKTMLCGIDIIIQNILIFTMNYGIFYGKMLGPHNIVLDLNNVMGVVHGHACTIWLRIVKNFTHQHLNCNPNPWGRHVCKNLAYTCENQVYMLRSYLTWSLRFWDHIKILLIIIFSILQVIIKFISVY